MHCGPTLWQHPSALALPPAPCPALAPCPCRQYSKAYVPLEEAAREARRGIWSGSFELPQKWRQDNPRGGGGGAKAAAAVVAAPAPLAAPAAAVAALPAAVAQPPAGCAIKGNITAKGERIYHVPGATDGVPCWAREVQRRGLWEVHACNS